VIVGSGFPELIPTAAEFYGSESQDVLRTFFRPEHTGLFAARTDDALAASFNDTGSDEVAFLTEGPVLHPVNVFSEIVEGFFHVPFALALAVSVAGLIDHGFHTVSEQEFDPASP
jgi:hypothetical protein